MLDTSQLALLAALLAVFVAIYVPIRNASRAAASSFRDVLLGKLSGLYPEPTSWPDNISLRLKDVFPDIQAAVAKFRPHVPFWKRRAFDRDWFAYYCSTGRDIDKNCQAYEHYMDFTSPDQPVPNGKQTFHRNVSRLLSYAREP